VAGTEKPSLKVREFSLSELERIARGALEKSAGGTPTGRVEIERLLQEGFRVKIVAYHELASKWKTYAFIDTTSKVVFVDADLIDNVNEEKKYRFTLAEELAHLLIHTSIFAGCKTIEDRLAIEDVLKEGQRVRLEHNAKALGSAILMPEKSIREFVDDESPKFMDEDGHVLVDELASAISRQDDVNFKPAKRRLKVLGYHRSHGWDLD
jgi:IrrE N-terminal-like domain